MRLIDAEHAVSSGAWKGPAGKRTQRAKPTASNVIPNLHQKYTRGLSRLDRSPRKYHL